MPAIPALATYVVSWGAAARTAGEGVPVVPAPSSALSPASGPSGAPALITRWRVALVRRWRAAQRAAAASVPAGTVKRGRA
ncbi:hypothetical protein [Streptomyces sp. MST-110588]|uniref:hypothetical protein n=1 Tax=Streptomyces sp. MST-110588 TaxID=2833628 RepID=UPI001F5C9EFE|nr:hypothetical protein [Streptomyces sp. MST-110588]UNO40307.1 hypothetical protein KGS77_12855 [Streptomyces sp. MST-110588]